MTAAQHAESCGPLGRQSRVAAGAPNSISSLRAVFATCFPVSGSVRGIRASARASAPAASMSFPAPSDRSRRGVAASRQQLLDPCHGKVIGGQQTWLHPGHSLSLLCVYAGWDRQLSQRRSKVCWYGRAGQADGQSLGCLPHRFSSSKASLNCQGPLGLAWTGRSAAASGANP